MHPGEEIDTSFVAEMVGGAVEEHGSGVAVSDFQPSVEGEQMVTITYSMDQAYSDTIYVYVIPSPTNLEISAEQNIFYYDQKPSWETTVTFGDGSTLSDNITESKTIEEYGMVHQFSDGTVQK